MGLFRAERSKLRLLIEQNDVVHEVEVKDSITISRETNKASVLTAEVIRNAMGGTAFTPEIGDIVAFTLDEDHNQFYGYIMQTVKHDRDWCTITAYDQLWYMSQNQHDWVFEDMTANEILEEICSMYEFGMLDPPSFLDTKYKIESLVTEGVSLLDTVQQALDITKENTGNDFYIWDDYGSVTLTDGAWLAGETALEISSDYITSYSYTQSALEDFYTVAVINSKENKKSGSGLTEDQKNPDFIEDDEGSGGTDNSETKKTNTKAKIATIASSSSGSSGSKKDDSEGGLTDWQKHPDFVDSDEAYKDEGEVQKETYSARQSDETIERYGIITYYGDLEDGEDAKEKAEQILNQYKEPTIKLSLSGVQGDITVRGGTPVLVNFFDSKQVEEEKTPAASGNDMIENIRGWFTVNSVTHNINQGFYTMDLECTLLKMYEDWGSDILHDESDKKDKSIDVVEIEDDEEDDNESKSDK